MSRIEVTASASTSPPVPTATVAVPGRGRGGTANRAGPGLRVEGQRPVRPGHEDHEPAAGLDPGGDDSAPGPEPGAPSETMPPAYSVHTDQARLRSSCRRPPARSYHRPASTRRSTWWVPTRPPGSRDPSSRHVPVARPKMPTTPGAGARAPTHQAPAVVTGATAVSSPTPHDRPAGDAASAARPTSSTTGRGSRCCGGPPAVGAGPGPAPRPPKDVGQRRRARRPGHPGTRPGTAATTTPRPDLRRGARRRGPGLVRSRPATTHPGGWRAHHQPAVVGHPGRRGQASTGRRSFERTKSCQKVFSGSPSRAHGDNGDNAGRRWRGWSRGGD